MDNRKIAKELVKIAKELTAKDIKRAVKKYAELVEKMIEEYYEENYSNLTPPTIDIDWGRNYARIVRVDNQKSVHSFVALKDINTRKITAQEGDILKAAGWSAPAKGVRGSVYNNNPLKGVNPYGADYR